MVPSLCISPLQFFQWSFPSGSLPLLPHQWFFPFFSPILYYGLSLHSFSVFSLISDLFLYIVSSLSQHCLSFSFSLILFSFCFFSLLAHPLSSLYFPATHVTFLMIISLFFSSYYVVLFFVLSLFYAKKALLIFSLLLCLSLIVSPFSFYSPYFLLLSPLLPFPVISPFWSFPETTLFLWLCVFVCVCVFPCISFCLSLCLSFSLISSCPPLSQDVFSTGSFFSFPLGSTQLLEFDSKILYHQYSISFLPNGTDPWWEIFLPPIFSIFFPLSPPPHPILVTSSFFSHPKWLPLFLLSFLFHPKIIFSSSLHLRLHYLNCASDTLLPCMMVAFFPSLSPET
ncbi:uncharacterized protein LOC127542726 [Antechinus flavipes]|uniref:uncharacterized protein LOC127542726 n=1 Tax=Antechinus flavipes TaxID=38775 RepID=UPI002235CDD3|nr:uncharacterized protein LOC127542726 [Antechinus flavipes]XP_051824456.1 uncharacterized protein LOC127542726 [Antechinus flavipes]XP_051824457.1 uncharacterized protein LOC127542726 [Antechinus flavipes]